MKTAVSNLPVRPTETASAERQRNWSLSAAVASSQLPPHQSTTCDVCVCGCVCVCMFVCTCTCLCLCDYYFSAVYVKAYLPLCVCGCECVCVCLCASRSVNFARRRVFLLR